MSEKVLSQEEISALLEAIGTDQGAAESPETQAASPKKRSGVELAEREGYLFPMAKATEISKDVESSLALVFDAFAHKGGASFSNTLRTQVGFRLHEVEQIFYGDFIESLPEPSSIWYLAVVPHNLHIAVCFEPELVTQIVAVMLGATGGGGTSRTRTQITELEQAIVENVVVIFCKELCQAWSRVSEVEIVVENRETRPRLLRVYPANEVMVTLGMSMKIASSEGTIYWGIPTGLLKTLQESNSHQRQIDSQEQLVEMVEHMKSHALRFSTCLEAELSETSVSISDLLSIQPGDVISLDHLVADPTRVSVNGRRQFLGEVVVSNDRRAIRLVSPN